MLPNIHNKTCAHFYQIKGRFVPPKRRKRPNRAFHELFHQVGEPSFLDDGARAGVRVGARASGPLAGGAGLGLLALEYFKSDFRHRDRDKQTWGHYGKGDKTSSTSVVEMYPKISFWKTITMLYILKVLPLAFYTTWQYPILFWIANIHCMYLQTAAQGVEKENRKFYIYMVFSGI